MLPPLDGRRGVKTEVGSTMPGNRRDLNRPATRVCAPPGPLAAIGLLALGLAFGPGLAGTAHAKAATAKGQIVSSDSSRSGTLRQAAAPAKAKKSGAVRARGKAGATGASQANAVKGPGSSPTWKIETVLERGDTLIAVLQRHGIDRRQAHTAVGAVADIFDPRRLDAGDKLVLTLERREAGPWLTALNLNTRAGQELTIQVDRGSPGARTQVAGAPTVVRRAEGVVKTSLPAALRAAKVPDPVAREVIAALAHDPDVPRVMPKQTRFSLVYEAEAGKRGLAKTTLRFVAVNIKGKLHPVYRYQMQDGDVVFVDRDGRGVTLIDLASPVQNAKVTSGFGWRTHPLYGDRRFHKGVDFAAPEGTAVHAADDGVVEEIGWRGNYGQYIRIRHRAGISTHYAHLSAFGPGLREGARVKRGQVIGRVGETGAATGPHLDYGVIVGDEHVDPLRAPPAIPIRLHGADLKNFQAYVRKAGPI